MQEEQTGIGFPRQLGSLSHAPCGIDAGEFWRCPDRFRLDSAGVEGACRIFRARQAAPSGTAASSTPLAPASTRAGGLVLSHFTHRIVPGWLDKALPWRMARGAWLDNVVLISPSREYLERLPLKKIAGPQ